MHSSAPSARARSSFSSLEEVTQTRAPQSLPICTPVDETPPPTPMMRRSSPARSRACDTSMRQAVMLTRTKAAASSYVIASGSLTTFRPSTFTYSASPPCVCSPRMP